MMDNKGIDYLTDNFDEMSTSDLCIWLEHHRDTDKICNRMYWDLDYVCKKWVKEIGESCTDIMLMDIDTLVEDREGR